MGGGIVFRGRFVAPRAARSECSSSAARNRQDTADAVSKLSSTSTASQLTGRGGGQGLPVPLLACTAPNA